MVRVTAAAVLAGLFVFTTMPAHAGSNCETPIRQTERDLGIPNGLLMAMALVESGRDGRAWPYTVTEGVNTRYAPSPTAAVAKFHDSRGRLRRNLFVGCLQLGLTYHHQAFAPVHRIIEPAANVAYGGAYLRGFYDKTGNWGTAVRRYNGGTPQGTAGYLRRVHRHLCELDPASARLLRASACGRSGNVEIAADVRRAFSGVEVASAVPESPSLLP